MEKVTTHLPVAFFLLILILTSSDKSYAQSYHSENLFYLQNSKEGYQSLLNHEDEISILCPQVYQIDSVGVITGEIDRRILELAQKKESK